MATTDETNLLTLSAIRKRKNQPSEYLFNEHQRIFTLSPESGDAPTRYLEAALKARRPVRVTTDLTGSTIAAVAEPTPDEVERFARVRIPLPRPAPSRDIEVAKLDPTTFNIVDYHLKWPIFRRCTRIIPTYAKAKEIFDFCAGLSCHLPGPPAVSPCIPFQYVRDGCYARAHQMRRIITTKYKYCCEKVFSYGNEGQDRLAVKADKWGGCCVTWWYHVAPLVRVRLRVRGLKVKRPIALAMVIDPGMFDKPVLLSTWLAAQENTSCHPSANVSSYSIQPGEAYTPGYSTDPNYTATEATLIAYKTLTTCP